MATDKNKKEIRLSRLARRYELDIYGESGLTQPTASALNAGARVLTYQIIMNMFVWGLTFFVTLYPHFENWFITLLAAAGFAALPTGLIFVIDRGLLLAASFKKFKGAMFARVGFILLAGIITGQALAVNLMKPDIDHRINENERNARTAIIANAKETEKLLFDGEDKNGDGTIAGDDELGSIERETRKYNGFDVNGDGKIEGDDEVGLIAEKVIEYDGDGTPDNKGLIELERIKYEGFDENGDGKIEGEGEVGLIGEAEAKVTGDESSARTTAQTALSTYLATRAAQRADMLKPYDEKVSSLTAERQAATAAKSREAGGAGISGRRGRGPAFKSLRESEQALIEQLAAATKTRADFLKSTVEPFDAETQRKAADLQAKIVSEPAAAKLTAESGLDALRRVRDRMLQELRDKRTADVSALRIKRDAALATERTNRKAALDAVEKMEGPALVEKYGGVWEQPRGLGARHEILHELIFESISMMIWYVIYHLLVMFVDLGVLLYKVQATEKLAKYLDADLQEIINDEDPGLAQLAAARGLSTNAAIRVRAIQKDETLARVKALYEARKNLNEAFGKWLKQPSLLCQPAAGPCLPKNGIRLKLEQLWTEMVQPHIVGVQDAVEGLESKGEGVPAWPFSKIIDAKLAAEEDVPGYPLLPGVDPATIISPWNYLTDEELERRGWSDPSDLLKQIAEVEQALEKGRRDLEQLVMSNVHVPLIDVIAEDRQIPMSKLRQQFAADFAYHGAVIVSSLNYIEGQEDFLRTAGQDVPAWNHPFMTATDDDAPDAFRSHLRQIWKLPTALLQGMFGWQGEDDIILGKIPASLTMGPVIPERPEKPVVEVPPAAKTDSVLTDAETEAPTEPDLNISEMVAQIDGTPDSIDDDGDAVAEAWWVEEDPQPEVSLKDPNGDGKVEAADDWARADRPVLSPKQDEDTKTQPYPVRRQPQPPTQQPS